MQELVPKNSLPFREILVERGGEFFNRIEYDESLREYILGLGYREKERGVAEKSIGSDFRKTEITDFF